MAKTKTAKCPICRKIIGTEETHVYWKPGDGVKLVKGKPKAKPRKKR
ncbi:MAG: hypothetical protein ABSH01_23995 [Terriglobia bacterium]|jgi:hypothetical protein